MTRFAQSLDGNHESNMLVVRKLPVADFYIASSAMHTWYVANIILTHCCVNCELDWVEKSWQYVVTVGAYHFYTYTAEKYTGKFDRKVSYHYVECK